MSNYNTNKTIPLYDQVKFDIWQNYQNLNAHINKYLTAPNEGIRRANYGHIKRYYREFMQLLITEKKIDILGDEKAKAYLLNIFYNARIKLMDIDMYLLQGLSSQMLEEFGISNFETQQVDLENFLVDEDEE